MLLKMYFILHSLIIMNKHRSSNMWSYGFAIFNALIVCAIPTLLLFFLLIEVKFIFKYDLTVKIYIGK